MMSLHPQRSRAGSAAATIAAMLALVPAAPTPGVAGEALPGPISAEVVEVIDGDTLAVRARIWLGQELTVRARIAGIDAPELRGRCAAERDLAVRARAFLIAAVDGHPIGTYKRSLTP